MMHARALGLAVAVALALPGPALAFRNVAVGGPVPALTLEGGGGQRLNVLVPGRVTMPSGGFRLCLVALIAAAPSSSHRLNAPP